MDRCWIRAPPRRAGPSPEVRLARRAAAARDDLPAILAEERGAVRNSDTLALTDRAPASRKRASGCCETDCWMRRAPLSSLTSTPSTGRTRWKRASRSRRLAARSRMH